MNRIFQSPCFSGLRFYARWWPQPQHEMSVHRSNPPNPGIHRRTKLKVIDNSDLGKQAMLSGRPPYCIHVYRQGWRRHHFPRARLGDKILVAIRGEMRKAYVVGVTSHFTQIQHGIPRSDTNNIVLLDDDGNPLGTRILAPIPTCLRSISGGRHEFAKILAIATKFI